MGSRRAFLRGAVLTAAAVTLPGASGAATALSVVASPTRLRRSVFVPHVGTSFVLTGGGDTHRAVLTEVSDSTRAKGHATRFGLTFELVGRARPADGTYTVSHPALRPFELYVGAIGPRAAGLLEAVVGG